MNKHTKIVGSLLDHGANPNIKNQFDRSPLDYLHFNELKKAKKELMREFVKRGGGFIYHPSHGEIVDLFFKLGYGSTFDIISEKYLSFGLCYGLSVASIIDFQDGERGVERFNKRLSIIGKYTTDELVNKINEANSIRYSVYKNNVNEIKKIRTEQALEPDGIVLDTSNLTTQDYKEIISKVIKAEFENLNITDKNELINYFLKLYLLKEGKSEIVEDIIHINMNEYYVKQQINTAINEFLIQKHLQEKTNIELNKQMPDEGVLILEIETIIQNVAIGHTRSRFSELLDEHQKKFDILQDMLSAFLLTSSIETEKRELIKIKGGSYVNTYNEDNLYEFLTFWGSSFKEEPFQSPISFLLHGPVPGHAISLTYLPTNKEWVLFDSNNAPAKSTKDIRELSKLIIRYLSFDDENDVTFLIDIFSSKNDAPILQKHVDQYNKSEKYEIRPSNKDAFARTARGVSDPEKVEKIFNESDDSFLKRNRGALAIGAGLSFGLLALGTAVIAGGIAAGVSLTVLSGGIAAAILAPIFLSVWVYITWSSDKKNLALRESKETAELEQSIHEMQNYPEPELSHTTMFNSLNIPKSNTAYKKHCESLNKNLKSQLMEFFEGKKMKIPSLVFFLEKE